MNRAKCVKRIFIQVASQGACEPSTNEQLNEQDSIETEILNSRTPQGWISFYTVAAHLRAETLSLAIVSTFSPKFTVNKLVF